MEHLTHLSTEALAGHRIVKAFGAEAREAAIAPGSTEGMPAQLAQLDELVATLDGTA